jgi:hypothetical protein
MPTTVKSGKAIMDTAKAQKAKGKPVVAKKSAKKAKKPMKAKKYK